jgi:uncharacterized protein YqjF (DUF2071 family)
MAHAPIDRTESPADSVPPTPSPFLTAEWRHLVMLNYEIDPAVVASLVPRGTEIDSWNGRVFASVVGFLFLDTRLRGIPIPFHRNFEEINLRFYVRRVTPSEVRRGVVFVKEVVPRRAIATVARTLYNENYVACRTGSSVRLPSPARTTSDGLVEYWWTSGGSRYRLGATFDGEPRYPDAGSEEEFITEHYWGYSSQRDGSTLEYRVAHPQWRVWRALESTLEGDVSAFYGPEFAPALSGEPSSAFVADGSEVTVFRGVNVSGALG